MNRLKMVITSVVCCGLLNFSLFGQARPDINDPQFTSQDRTDLANLIMQFVTSAIVEDHCDYTSIVPGMDIHDAQNLLPFHKMYIEGLEDFLIESGRPDFVPLPGWDPGLGTVPVELRVVDFAACNGATCTSGNGPCTTPSNWTWTGSIPSNLLLSGTLCNYSTQSSLAMGMMGYHASGHVGIGGVMGNFRSPSAPIFWLWHAHLDDIWKEWECNCPTTNTNFDFYMKDTPKVIQSERDLGSEPNSDMGPMWVSEDIWVRQQQDGLTNHTHENAEYAAISTNYNYVYVHVRNRGCAPTSGTNTLNVYWAKAGTSLSYPSHWNGSLTTVNGDPIGDIIGSVTLPVLKPGESTVIEVPWQPVNPSLYTNLDNTTDPLFWIGAPEPHHFCLLARIESTGDPISFTSGSNLNEYVRQNNNVVWKNISVVDLNPNNKVDPGGWANDHVFGAAVLVGDNNGDGGTFDLEFDNPLYHPGNHLTEEAEVKITLSPILWEKWSEGGFMGTNLKIINNERYQVLLTGTPAKLENLTFGEDETNLMHVGFNFLSEQLSGQEKFRFNVIQRTVGETDIIGGETYDIILPERHIFYADAGSDYSVKQGTEVTLEAYDIGEDAIYNWYDLNRELLHTGQYFTVTPDVSERYMLEVIALEDGVKDYDDVLVTVLTSYLKTISPNPVEEIAVVQYELDENVDAAYLVVSNQNGSSTNFHVDMQDTKVAIDLSGFVAGGYTVTLMCDNVPVDTKTIIVQ